MARSLAILVAVLALGVAVAVAVYVLDQQPVAVRAESIEAPGSDELDRQILATLERIEASLARLESRPTIPVSSGSPNADVAALSTERVDRETGARSELSTEGDEQERIAQLLLEMRAVLDEHVAAESAWREQSRSLGELKASQEGADWKALDKLIDQWHTDQDAAKEATQLLAFQDVLKKYGTPTEIWKNEKGAHWVYQRGVDEVYFRFNDGFVTVLGVK